MLHEGTQTEATYLRELLAVPSLMTFDVRTGDMQYETRPMLWTVYRCIGAVTVVISESNNNGNDSGNVNTTSGIGATRPPLGDMKASTSTGSNSDKFESLTIW